MESPRNHRRDIKLYELEINGQKILFVVEKRNGNIWKITVVADEDRIELRLNEFHSKTQELGTRVAKLLINVFKRVDDWMRGETPEEQQQQKDYENIKNSLIARLVKYTHQDRKDLEAFLEQFSWEELKEFYEFLNGLVLNKESGLTKVVVEEPEKLERPERTDKVEEFPAKKPNSQRLLINLNLAELVFGPFEILKNTYLDYLVVRLNYTRRMNFSDEEKQKYIKELADKFHKIKTFNRRMEIRWIMFKVYNIPSGMEVKDFEGQFTELASKLEGISIRLGKTSNNS